MVKIKRVSAGVGLAAILLCTAPLADAAKTQAVILGYGARPCAEWTADRAGPPSFGLYGKEGWLGGYLSAFNAYGADSSGNIQDGMEAETIWVWFDNYCRANPEAQLADAAAALITERRSRKRGK